MERSETPRFGMSRAQAADHIGIGVSLFDTLVLEGKMPPARKVGTRLIWIRREIEDALESLPYSGHRSERMPAPVNALDLAIARRNGQSTA